MGKFKWRAFKTGCASCKDTQATLYKLDPIYICMSCKIRLEKTGSIDIHNGGELKRLLGTNKVFYIPPKKQEEVVEESKQDN